jgi:nitrogen fixation NifU-like protein
MDYSALVHNHFANPRNVGLLAPAANVICVSCGSSERGVEITLSARIDQDRLVAIEHLVYGCPHSIAAASWLSERLRDATLVDLARWKWKEAADALNVPAEKWGRLLVLEDAVRSLETTWRDLLSNHAQKA